MGERVLIHYSDGFSGERVKKHHWRIGERVREVVQGLSERSLFFFDMGCGNGFLSKMLEAENLGHVVGVDYSAEAIAFAEQNNTLISGHYACFDVVNYLKNLDAGLLDYALDVGQEMVLVGVEFLEHLSDPREFCLLAREKLGPVLMVFSFPVHEEGYPLQQGFHKHEFTPSRVKQVFDGFMYDLKLLFFDGERLVETDEVGDGVTGFVVVRT